MKNNLKVRAIFVIRDLTKTLKYLKSITYVFKPNNERNNKKRRTLRAFI